MAKKLMSLPRRPVNPTVPALITSVDRDGKPNIITLAETYNLSINNPVIVGIGIHKARYSHSLITECRQFVVNLPPASLVEKVDLCGTRSGRDVDKFAAFGLTPLPAAKVRPPLIAECPVNLECELIGVHEIGDHDMFMGQVLAQYVDEEALDEQGQIVPEKLDLLAVVFMEYWKLGRPLGRAGFTRKRKEQ